MVRDPMDVSATMCRVVAVAVLMTDSSFRVLSQQTTGVAVS
jgi:hypothetical protein